MKNLSIISALLFAYLTSCGQEYRWERIDSVPKTKDQIYSDTKMFIAETWNSAINVIQNDDKENGVILVKGTTSIDITFMLNPHNYTYSYTVKFYMKDGKHRIVIEDVKCYSATCQGAINWPKLEPGQTSDYGTTGVPNKKAEEIMVLLKERLQAIVDTYSIYMKKESVNNSDW